MNTNEETPQTTGKRFLNVQDMLKDSPELQEVCKPYHAHNNSFYDALDCAQNLGNRITRASWPEGVFVFVQVPSEVSVTIISKMSSLPRKVKEFFEKRGEPITYKDQLALVTPDNVIRGWTPLPEDALAKDWTVLDFDIFQSYTETQATASEETAGTAKPLS